MSRGVMVRKSRIQYDHIIDRRARADKCAGGCDHYPPKTMISSIFSDFCLKIKTQNLRFIIMRRLTQIPNQKLSYY